MASSPLRTRSAIAGRPGHAAGPRFHDVAGLELVDPGQAFTASQHDRRRDAFDHVADEPAGDPPVVEGFQRGS